MKRILEVNGRIKFIVLDKNIVGIFFENGTSIIFEENIYEQAKIEEINNLEAIVGEELIAIEEVFVKTRNVNNLYYEGYTIYNFITKNKKIASIKWSGAIYNEMVIGINIEYLNESESIEKLQTLSFLTPNKMYTKNKVYQGKKAKEIIKKMFGIKEP